MSFLIRPLPGALGRLKGRRSAATQGYIKLIASSFEPHMDLGSELANNSMCCCLRRQNRHAIDLKQSVSSLDVAARTRRRAWRDRLDEKERGHRLFFLEGKHACMHFD